MATAGRPRDLHKEQFWRQTLQRFARSKLSATRFCQLHKLPLHSFWAWKRTLHLRDQANQHQRSAVPDSDSHKHNTPRLPLFLPLQLQQLSTLTTRTHALEVLLPNGLRLSVPTNFEPAAVAQLLTLLRGTSC